MLWPKPQDAAGGVTRSHAIMNTCMLGHPQSVDILITQGVRTRFGLICNHIVSEPLCIYTLTLQAWQDECCLVHVSSCNILLL